MMKQSHNDILGFIPEKFSEQQKKMANYREEFLENLSKLSELNRTFFTNAMGEISDATEQLRSIEVPNFSSKEDMMNPKNFEVSMSYLRDLSNITSKLNESLSALTIKQFSSALSLVNLNNLSARSDLYHGAHNGVIHENNSVINFAKNSMNEMSKIYQDWLKLSDINPQKSTGSKKNASMSASHTKKSVTKNSHDKMQN